MVATLIWRPGFPEALESHPCNPCVVDSVLRIAVAKVVLDEPEVVPLVRQIEPPSVDCETPKIEGPNLVNYWGSCT